jgi:hypothetical protein
VQVLLNDIIPDKRGPELATILERREGPKVAFDRNPASSQAALVQRTMTAEIIERLPFCHPTVIPVLDNVIVLHRY